MHAVHSAGAHRAKLSARVLGPDAPVPGCAFQSNRQPSSAEHLISMPPSPASCWMSTIATWAPCTGAPVYLTRSFASQSGLFVHVGTWARGPSVRDEDHATVLEAGPYVLKGKGISAFRRSCDRARLARFSPWVLSSQSSCTDSCLASSSSNASEKTDCTSLRVLLGCNIRRCTQG